MKNFWQSILILVVLLLPMGCTNSNPSSKGDIYIGEYISIDEELPGELKIEKSEGIYKILFEFYDLTEILATGEENNGTLVFEGFDKYGNTITGNIEEYGEDYPIRVEIHGDGLFSEVEFERK